MLGLQGSEAVLNTGICSQGKEDTRGKSHNSDEDLQVATVLGGRMHNSFQKVLLGVAQMELCRKPQLQGNSYVRMESARAVCMFEQSQSWWIHEPRRLVLEAKKSQSSW